VFSYFEISAKPGDLDSSFGENGVSIGYLNITLTTTFYSTIKQYKLNPNCISNKYKARHPGRFWALKTKHSNIMNLSGIGKLFFQLSGGG
jgi:hypothetical protein